MKKQIFKRPLIFYLSIFIIIGCSASSRLTKEAQKFEKSGLIEEAADSYYHALKSNKDNINAKIGLKRTSQQILEKKIESFRALYKLQNYNKAYEKFTDAVRYQEKIKKVGVLIDITTSDLNLFNDVKNILAQIHYQKGKKYLNRKSYSNAIDEFMKAKKYVPNYHDLSALIREAKNYKNIESAKKAYHRGLRLLKSEKYKDAYNAFKECLGYKSNYKDAFTFMNEALKKGKIRIAIFPFKNDTRIYNAEKKLYAYVVSKAVNCPSPFVEVIDRNNLEKLLLEQRLGMSGIIDEATAARAGKILGLKAVVLGRLIDIQKTSNLKKTPIEAFDLSYNYGKSKGKKVTVNVYDGSSSVTFKAQYQIIDTETGRILSSDIVSSSAKDYVKYANYNGNIEYLSLYDPNVVGQLGSLLGKRFVGDLDKSLFSARKNLKSPQEMFGQVVENLGDRISGRICNYFD